MPTYAPTSTVFPSGVISITGGGGTDYNIIQNSISGGSVYRIDDIYLKADTITQLLQNIIFQKYNSNGNIKNRKVVPTVDPYSYQSALFIDMDSDEYILDGRLVITYNLLASATVYFYLNTTCIKPSDLLSPIHDQNIQDFLKTYDFFEEYTDEIEIDYDK